MEDRATYHGPTCSHPHNPSHNDECSVWWLRGTPAWKAAHTRLGYTGPDPGGPDVTVPADWLADMGGRDQ